MVLPFQPRPMMPPGAGPMVPPPLPPGAVTLPPGLGMMMPSDGPRPTPMPVPNPMAGMMGMQPPMPQMPPGMMGGMPPMGMPGMGGMPPMGGPPGLPPGMPPGLGAALGPMGQPAPPPPPPTLLDAMQMADATALVEMLLDQFEQAQKDADKPIYPPDFKRPKKPDAASLLALVEMDRRAQSERNGAIDYDLAVARREEVGKFKEDAERPWFEPFQSNALANEIENAVNFISALPSTFEVTARDPAKRDAAQDCEDAVYWAWDEIREQHAASGGGDVDRDMAWHAIATGWVAGRLTPDPTCAGFPAVFRLFDIRSVFPRYDGKRGLERVSVVYSDTLNAVVADFDDGKGRIRRALADRYTDDEFDDPTLVVTVTEVWDRWWRCVFVGDTVVVPVTAHKFGFVPFEIVPTGGGEPSSTNEPISSAIDGRTYNRDYAGWSRHTQAYKSTPLIRNMIPAFLQQQKIMGKLMTRARHADNPALLLKQTPSAQRFGVRPLDITPGAANPLIMDEEEAQPFDPSIAPDVMNPLMANLTRELAQTSTPGSMIGNIDRSNVTGVAIEGMNEAGARRYTPAIKGIDTFRKRISEMFLKYVMDMGRLLGEDGRRGELDVPRRQPKTHDEPVFTLTQETVREAFGKSYPRVKVRSTSLTNQQRIAMMNMYQMGIKGNIFSERWAREDFGIENPDAMQREILEEKALTEPDINKILMFRALEKQGDRRLVELFQKFVLEKPREGEGGPPGMGGPPPGGGSPSGIGTQGGVSLPMNGMPSGQNGGRPALPPGLMSAMGG